jgi:riboflavin kinase, archaea type
MMGKVTSGVGEGRRYVQQYLPILEKTLGFTCFPGTLNIEVNNIPELKNKITVLGPEENSVPVDCHLICIQDTYEGAIVRPHISKHGKNILELVAPINLREKLNVQDGDEIQCELV